MKKSPLTDALANSLIGSETPPVGVLVAVLALTTVNIDAGRLESSPSEKVSNASQGDVTSDASRFGRMDQGREVLLSVTCGRTFA